MSTAGPSGSSSSSSLWAVSAAAVATLVGSNGSSLVEEATEKWAAAFAKMLGGQPKILVKFPALQSGGEAQSGDGCTAPLLHLVLKIVEARSASSAWLHANFCGSDGRLWLIQSANARVVTHAGVPAAVSTATFAQTDADGRLRGWRACPRCAGCVDANSCHYFGLGDPRAFSLNSGLYAVASVLLDEHAPRRRVALVHLSSGRGVELHTRQLPLQGTEKNWAPLVIGRSPSQRLFLVYSYEPLRLLRLDSLATGECTLVHGRNSTPGQRDPAAQEWSARIVRGGTQFVPCDGHTIAAGSRRAGLYCAFAHATISDGTTGLGRRNVHGSHNVHRPFLVVIHCVAHEEAFSVAFFGGPLQYDWPRLLRPAVDLELSPEHGKSRCPAKGPQRVCQDAGAPWMVIDPTGLAVVRSAAEADGVDSLRWLLAIDLYGNEGYAQAAPEGRGRWTAGILTIGGVQALLREISSGHGSETMHGGGAAALTFFSTVPSIEAFARSKLHSELGQCRMKS